MDKDNLNPTINYFYQIFRYRKYILKIAMVSSLKYDDLFIDS